MNKSSNPEVLILPKSFWSHTLADLSYALFWGATLYLVVISFGEFNNAQGAALGVGLIYIAGFLCFLASRIVSKHGYSKLKYRVIEWAYSKYGITFTKEEARSLITPSYGHYKQQNYQSQAVRQWYVVDNGRKELATYSIITVDGEPLLYRQEIGGESQTEEERLRQQIISVFAEEIGGNQMVYLYSDANSLEPSANDVALLWSDALRVELYVGKDGKLEQSSVYAIPVDAFFEKWVPSATAKGVRVGINWHENDLLFDTRSIFKI